MGAWWETDGVSGSVNPTSLLPAGAHIIRFNYTEFGFGATVSGDPYPHNGVSVAMSADGSPSYFTEVDVIVPASQHAMATQILNQDLQANRNN